MTKLALIVAIGLLVASTGAVGSAHGTPAKACKRGQVAIRLGRKVSCRPAAAVLPRPKAIDVRLAELRSALALDSSSLRRFGAAGKNANARFARALPKVLSLIDAHRKKKKRPTRSLSAWRASRGSMEGGCNSSAGPASSGSAQGLDITGITDNGAVMDVTINGLRFRTRFAVCGDHGIFYPPECPKANGDADASGSSSFEITQEVWDGAKLVSRRSTSTTEKVKLHGKVADDARLDYLDVVVTQETLIVASGGVVRRGTAVRRIRVNMRTGSYDPGNSSVDIQGDADAAGGQDGGQSIAATVAAAIGDYREAEIGGGFLHTDGWATFERKGKGDYCATAVFDPKSKTLQLQAGQGGHVAIYAKARSGGRATGARWQLIDPTNASFSPTSAHGPSPSVSYRVKTAPTGSEVEVTAKFTSTAGVGKDTWTQSLQDRYTGSFSGHTRAGNAEELLDYSFSGTVTLARRQGIVYTIEKIDWRTMVTVSGTCNGSASESESSGRSDQAGTLLLADDVTPGKGRLYSIAFGVNPPASVPLKANCGGTTIDIPWQVQAQVSTGSQPFYTDADATRLQGTYSVPGTQISTTWDLKRG